MGKKRFCVTALFFIAAILWAGDSAVFVDLGFSPDGRTYMFAQYGVQDRTLRPWADLFVVDVARNSFVEGGRVSYTHDRQVVSGQDGSGAFYHVLVRNAALVERNRVNHSIQGQPLYIALDNAAPSSPIEFRNFETGDSYRADLVQNTEGAGTNLRSFFQINLTRTSRDGSTQRYVVGTPAFRRPNVASYRIRQVIAHSNSMIFVIEMRVQDGAHFSIRYMIEAIRL
jgi:predicted secreted protein